jgi:hypothetical protein
MIKIDTGRAGSKRLRMPEFSLINEPLAPDNVSTLARAKQRSLHATLVESLTSMRALLQRFELGVHVPRDQQRETVRAL